MNHKVIIPDLSVFVKYKNLKFVFFKRGNFFSICQTDSESIYLIVICRIIINKGVKIEYFQAYIVLLVKFVKKWGVKSDFTIF